jgi:hypothetical protein
MLRRPEPCPVCAPALLGEGDGAAEEPPRPGAFCVRCDPGWSAPARPVTRVEPAAGAPLGPTAGAHGPIRLDRPGPSDYPRAGGMFWLSRKRFSGS